MPLVRKPGANHPAAGTGRPTGTAELGHGDAASRWAAARAAASDPSAVPALAAALHTETDVRVREALFSALARIGTPDSVAAALALLRSNDANLRTGALDALRLMTAAVSERLPHLLRDDDVDIRVLSCELARSLPSAQATPLLCALLMEESNDNVCAAALDVLAEVGNPTALPALQACAERFRDSPFLVFAIQTAAERIAAQSVQQRG